MGTGTTVDDLLNNIINQYENQIAHSFGIEKRELERKRNRELIACLKPILTAIAAAALREPPVRAELEKACAKLRAENAWLKVQLKEAWKEGFKSALHRFAWWKDGIQWVGSGVKSLSAARHDLEEETKGGN